MSSFWKLSYINWVIQTTIIEIDLIHILHWGSENFPPVHHNTHSSLSLFWQQSTQHPNHPQVCQTESKLDFTTYPGRGGTLLFLIQRLFYSLRDRHRVEVDVIGRGDGGIAILGSRVLHNRHGTTASEQGTGAMSWWRSDSHHEDVKPLEHLWCVVFLLLFISAHI